MDPNANLREQEQLLRKQLFVPLDWPDAARLVQLRASLKDWLDKGGFAPLWHECPLASKRYLEGARVRLTTAQTNDFLGTLTMYVDYETVLFVSDSGEKRVCKLWEVELAKGGQR